MRLYAEVEPLALDALSSIRDVWSSVADSSNCGPYLALGWLESWAAVYAPRKLWLVRIAARGSSPVALGLLDGLPGRRLRFAGAPVTPVRQLLALPGHEQQAWSALGHWLAAHRSSWNLLDAEGVAPGHRVPGALMTTTPWFALDLPPTFDAYLAQRSASTRATLRRKLRAMERAGAAIVPVAPEGRDAALETLVRLHSARARAKGERHKTVDGRLAQMLAAVAHRGDPAMRVMAIEQAGRMVAVTVRLDAGTSSWFYNAGFDPTAARLSPGLTVELASVRDAIAQGQQHYDLGPGNFRYKRDLGGVRADRVWMQATSKGVPGRALRAAIRVRHHARALAAQGTE